MMPRANPARLAELARIIQRDSSNLPALLEAGHLYLAEQRLDEAAVVTMRALQLDPRTPEGLAHVAVLLMAEGTSHDDRDSAQAALRGALDAVDQALRLKPDLAEAWLFKGMIYMAGLRDPASAAQAWEQYLKVAPADADTARLAAMVRGIRGR
jgi:tetratricopeptide (TPR) repeat protein